ncbi:ABC transporter periplasmic component [Kitasatospora herbaricolor]|uniref:ABC transporter substrate-binding protein n=1 Tax=Kitasatospora herbaricolor TaxID=68217 RepID=UPI001748DAE3|nr:iron-siderophore ABC transporter substrate-binding protein [Kitasatospora herbaricolor]MDQ0311659.1 iron complex transport system substrate-binding protein [Kitasatospora herbaricolor]GGU95825.1 ABC transporter periplasmic component [Kitasatospora herbaricolor]
MSRTPHRSAVAAVALAGCLALGGCGSGTPAGPAGGEAAGTGGSHVVRHARGESTVPARPARVVVLDTDSLDSAITLGITPVGATTTAAGAPLPGYLPAERLKDVKPVGTIGSPNLEAIAALRPDLILSSQARDDKHYEDLTKIAPTVLTRTTGPAWQENFRLHAEALGRQNEARSAEDGYRAKAGALVAALGGPEKAKALKVEVARFLAGSPTRLYLNDTFIGSILRDLGLGRPANQDRTGFSLEISPEQVDRAAADVIFWSTYGDAAKSDQAAITGGALWKNLDAVRNNRTFQVDDDLWMLGIGYTGAGLILDRIRRDLTASPAP